MLGWKWIISMLVKGAQEGRNWPTRQRCIESRSSTWCYQPHRKGHKQHLILNMNMHGWTSSTHRRMHFSAWGKTRNPNRSTQGETDAYRDCETHGCSLFSYPLDFVGGDNKSSQNSSTECQSVSIEGAKGQTIKRINQGNELKAPLPIIFFPSEGRTAQNRIISQDSLKKSTRKVWSELSN